MLSTRAQAAAHDQLQQQVVQISIQRNHQPGTSTTVGTGCLEKHVQRTLLPPFYNPRPSLPLPAFMTAGQCRWGQRDDTDLMWKRKGGRNGSAKGKRILLRRQKEANGGPKTPSPAALPWQQAQEEAA